MFPMFVYNVFTMFAMCSQCGIAKWAVFWGSGLRLGGAQTRGATGAVEEENKPASAHF